MMNPDTNTQKMVVTVSFEVDEEIFEGETDMYKVAEDVQDYLAGTLRDVTLIHVREVNEASFKVSVKPQLT